MATAISDIEVYEALKSNLGEDGAKTLVNFVEARVDNGFQARLDTFATKKDISELKISTKQDIALLKEEITDFKFSTKEDMAQLEVRLSQDIAQIDVKLSQDIAKLDVKLSETKAELIKWAFIFMVGQTAAIIGILKLLH